MIASPQLLETLLRVGRRPRWLPLKRLRCTHKSFRVAPQAFDPPNPPSKGGQKPLKVPLLKGDLGGYTTILVLYTDVCTP